MSAVAGVTEPGDRILIGRNCHRSVYNAIELNRLKCGYLYPEYIEEPGICSEVTAVTVEEALKKNPDTVAVVITSPTYEGICSDVRSVAEAVHRMGKLLIVDAAHGAHFGFHKEFPQNAVKQGADIVIHSVHKTLPSPTQTALIHLNCGAEKREAAERMLRIYQSSSPSYLLMAGIDNCMSIIGDKGSGLFETFFGRLCKLEKDLNVLKRLKHINRKFLKEEYRIFDIDPGKLIISVRGAGITGRELYDMLRNEYDIQPEMASDSYCLLIMTVMDTKEGFEKVKNALICIDEKISDDAAERKHDFTEDIDNTTDLGRLYSKPVKQVMPVHEALAGSRQLVSLKKAEGRISAGYISLYPPGIPLLVPGEEITAELAAGIEEALKQGLTVQGTSKDGKIKALSLDA